jgi:hypothetical protein
MNVFASFDQNGSLGAQMLALPPLTPGRSLNSLNWSCYILYADHNRSDRSSTLTGSATAWGPLTLSLDQIAQVGTLHVSVTFTVEDVATGAVQTKNIDYTGAISGTNPTKAATAASPICPGTCGSPGGMGGAVHEFDIRLDSRLP